MFLQSRRISLAVSTRKWSVTLAFAFFASAAPALDQDSDQLSDVWELIFGAQSLIASADTDGDGSSNLVEAAAGTNPYDPTSFPGLSVQPAQPGSVLLTWSSAAGKTYDLQGSADIAVPAWPILSAYSGTGSLLSSSLPTGGLAQFFFRIAINDLHSNTPELSDWEKLQLGFDPVSSHTDRYDQTDLQRIIAGIAANAPNVVTIGALDGEMTERWPDPGVVSIRRAGGGLRPLTVNLALGGTAASGVDYTPSATNTIFIPAGVREVWVDFQPIADGNDGEPPETITATLQAGTGYTLGSDTVATVTLLDESTASLPSAKSAARFLIQAAFGPDADSASDGDITPENVEEVMQLGFDGWINDQFARPVGLLQPFTEYAPDIPEFYTDPKQAAWWNRAMGVPKLKPDDADSVLPDPLRQRVGFALSQIFVISDRPETLAVQPAGMANYYDTLLKNAFGNFRTLLYDVSLHPCMGHYLSHLLNRKPNPATNTFPDENYAREVMQLFSIGLWQLNPDGTRQLNAQGQPIPTYDNTHITEFARVFTGLGFAGNVNFTAFPQNFLAPMKLYDSQHDCNPKTLLNGFTLPARTASNPDTGAAAFADINATIDHLFNHSNVGPFIGRQLIQRFVTSNPSPGYVSRVAAAFANNGQGVRGDMQAVIKAVLLDSEARDPAFMAEAAFGKLREPFLRCVNLARAFNAAAQDGFYQLGSFYMDHYQEPLRSPSVFNFYQPNYSPPGILNDAGLAAPEFQIINAGSAISAPNYFYNALRFNDLHRWGAGSASRAVRLELTQELSLVVPAAMINQNVPNVTPLPSDPLLRRLDLALTGGALSPEQFQIIRESIERIPNNTWQWHRQRVWLAIYLILTSPDFCVQR